MRAKLLISTVLSAVLLCSMPTASAFAQTSRPGFDIVSPMYEIAKDPKSTLLINGKNAVCTSYTSSNSLVSITAEQTLQKYWGLWIWDEVKDASWTETVNDNNIYISNTKTDLESGKYRLKSVFTLTDSNGKSETITVYSNEQVVS